MQTEKIGQDAKQSGSTALRAVDRPLRTEDAGARTDLPGVCQYTGATYDSYENKKLCWQNKKATMVSGSWMVWHWYSQSLPVRRPALGLLVWVVHGRLVAVPLCQLGPELRDRSYLSHLCQRLRRGVRPPIRS